MGTRQSQLEKATSPYSSWGSSFDDLLCGQGKICSDRWTPTPSRSQSMSRGTRRGTRDRRHETPRDHRRRTTHSDADIYTIRHEDSSSLLDSPRRITQQPLPIEALHLSSPNDPEYLLPATRMSRRSSYRPYEHHSRRLDTYDSDSRDIPSDPAHYAPVITARMPMKKKKKPKKKKRTSSKLPKVNPTQPIQIFIDLNGMQKEVHHGARYRLTNRVEHRSRSRTRSPPRAGRAVSEPRTSRVLAATPRRRNHSELRSRRSPYSTPSLPESISRLSAAPSGFFERLPKSSKHTSSTGSSALRVIPPRDNKGKEPPVPFRFRGVKDAPYKRLSTALPRT